MLNKKAISIGLDNSVQTILKYNNKIILKKIEICFLNAPVCFDVRCYNVHGNLVFNKQVLINYYFILLIKSFLHSFNNCYEFAFFIYILYLKENIANVNKKI